MLNPKTQANYEGRTLEEIVWMRPDLWIGTLMLSDMKEFIWTDEVDEVGKLSTIQQKHIHCSQGLENVFLEILINASDNAWESRRMGGRAGTIRVEMDNKTISVRSEGFPIPIEEKEGENCYVPEFIFGSFLSGSSYDDEDVSRQSGGRNGVGAKLVNKYSKRFVCEIYDEYNKKHYIQRWFDNMTVKEPPTIEDYDGPSSVTITYDLDIDRFSVEEYSEDIFNLYKRYLADVSFTTKIVTYFNGEMLNYISPERYYRLYFPQIDNRIVYEQGDTTIIAVDTPFKAKIIAFSNSIPNPKGGTHFEAALEAVSRSVINSVNNPENGKKSNVKITKRDIRNHISLIVSVHVSAVNASYDSQCKLQLTSPNMRFNIPQEMLNPISKWGLKTALTESLRMKKMKKIYDVSTKRKRKSILVDDLIDAKKAGGPDSHKCILIITEGKSALTYAKYYRGLLPDEEKDYIGMFPLRGKSINALKASDDRLKENRIISSIIEILNLEGSQHNNELQGLDYRDRRNFARLRYGEVKIIADADVDGQHIKGLIIAFFEKFNRSLLEIGYISDFRTPYLRVFKDDEAYSFIYEAEYELWKHTKDDLDGWLHSYFKGLGTSEISMIEEDVRTGKTIRYVYDENATESIDLAYGPKTADKRKEVLYDWKPDFSNFNLERSSDGYLLQDYSDLIYTDVMNYHFHNVIRSIPSIDGLKPSQRKVLKTVLDKYGYSCYKDFINRRNIDNMNRQDIAAIKKKLYSYNRKVADMKVFSMTAMVQQNTQYHHGNDALDGTITKMAQRFPGRNNLPYLRNIGLFGSREENGKDCSKSRYISTSPEWWLKYCYFKEDECSLEILIEENHEIEPRLYYPIVPMSVINGTMGIGTGWRSTIPAHNPIKVIEWYLSKIGDEELPEIKPWYHGFTGESDIGYREVSKKRKETVTIVDPDNIDDEGEVIDIEVEYDRNSSVYFWSKGVYERIGSNKLHIIELPIGLSTERFRRELKKCSESGVIKRNYSDRSDPDKIDFTITLNQEMEDSEIYKTFKLQSKIGLTSMVLLDINGRPRKYESVLEIMEDFYEIRLQIYENRKESIIKNMQELLYKNREKIRYIKAEEDGLITFKDENGRSVSKQVPIEQCKSLDLDTKLLQMKMINMSTEYKEKLEKKCVDIERDVEVFSEKDSIEMWIDELSMFKEVLEANYELMFY